jgi:hypothetical protein
MTRHAYARAQQAGIAVGPLLAKAGLTERQVRDRSVRINARQLIPQSRRSGHRRSGSRLSHRADLRSRAALLCGSLIEEEVPANGSRISRRCACRSKRRLRRWKRPRKSSPSILQSWTAMSKWSMPWPRPVAVHAEAEDNRGSLVKAFRALVHRVMVHPNGPIAMVI